MLQHYEKKRDWESLEKWVKAGQDSFGKHHKDYISYLIKAKEGLGDKEGVLDIKIDHFLRHPEASEFDDLRKYAESISKWDEVIGRLLISIDNYSKQQEDYISLKAKLLLAIGREREKLKCLEKAKFRFETEEIKFVAKYGVARASAECGLSSFLELRQLDNRSKEENSDLYQWLRFALKHPAKLKRVNYAKLSAQMYQVLVDFHFNSGKSSRASYAVYYSVIIKELLDLVEEPSIWDNFLQYLRQRYSKKRLIWNGLRQRNLIT